MNRKLRKVLVFLFVLYVLMSTIDLVSHIMNTYVRFEKFGQQHCALIQMMSNHKQCNRLISYRYQMITFEDSHHYANEYYVSIYQLKFDAMQHLIQRVKEAEHDGAIFQKDQSHEYFFAQTPSKRVWLLPHLKKYCLGSSDSCIRKKMGSSDNYIKEYGSYLVYGQDQLFEKIDKAENLTCNQNLILNNDVIKKNFEGFQLYIPRSTVKTTSLICYDKESSVVRLISKVTTASLR